MIARRDLPREFRYWNAVWGAPYGSRPSFVRRLRRRLVPGIGRSVENEARSRGPFAWQSNNSNRIFEYPWAYHAIRRQGSHLRVLEIGGGLSGLQFVLAAEGDSVINVDPGQSDHGWKYETDIHQRLCSALRAPVQLFTGNVGSLEASPQSFDVILTISSLEHFPDSDVAMLASAIRRLLKPDGIVVMTIDLFLDLTPFSDRVENQWGRNLDVRKFLNMAGLSLREGNPAELLGFPEFSPAQIMSNLATYLVGEGYPNLSECVIAQPDCHKVRMPTTFSMASEKDRKINGMGALPLLGRTCWIPCWDLSLPRGFRITVSIHETATMCFTASSHIGVATLEMRIG